MLRPISILIEDEFEWGGGQEVYENMGVNCIMCTNDSQTNKHTSENFLYPKHTYILLYKAIGVTFKYPKPINNPLPDNGLLPGSVSTPDLRVGSELLT